MSSFSRWLALALLGSAIVMPVSAATPASGTLTTSANPPVYTTKTFVASNPAGTGDQSAACPSGASDPVCDEYALTVTLPDDYVCTNPQASISIVLASTDVDYDLFVYDSSDNLIGTSTSGTANESVTLAALQGSRGIRVEVSPFTATGGNGKVTIKLAPGTPRPVGQPCTNEPAPLPVYIQKPTDPRYYTYRAPDALNGDTGEPSIGYNQTTHNVMMVSGLKTLFAKLPDRKATNPGPASCEADWAERSATTTSKQSLDPIGLVDSLIKGKETTRSWVCQEAGTQCLASYSDDDGVTWTVSQGDGAGAGADHQTIAAGPYPTPLPSGVVRPPNTTYPNAFYYCAQGVATATCTRSDDGGLTFREAHQMYTLAGTGNNVCAGLHGHGRVGVDGTFYVPNGDCGGKAGVAVSTDAGLTFNVRKVPTPADSGFDPQVAVSKNGTDIYMCFTDQYKQAMAIHSKDKGVTWDAPVPLGVELGVLHAAFPQGVAGDADRATCGFMGTQTDGNPDALDFAGVFHAYIATTYDSGKNWVTVQINPKDPTQGVGGIHNGGGSAANRNLLDFMEMTIDDRGYPIYGYVDGCTGPCIADPKSNAFEARPLFTRQVAGKSLYAAFDKPQPTVPDQSCLAGTRVPGKSTLTWREPENGGAAITNYKVYRSLTPGGVGTLIGNAGAKAAFVDETVDDTVAKYYYTVIADNTAGSGKFSNEVELPIIVPIKEDFCAIPGVTVLSDAKGDENAAQNGIDIRSINFAETDALEGSIEMSLKVESLNPLPSNIRWAIRFMDGKAPPSGGLDWYVALITNGQTPSYEYGYTSLVDATATSARVFNKIGNLPATSTFTAAGLITFVVPKNLIGNPGYGQQFTGITASTRAATAPGVPGAGAALDTTGDGSYKLRNQYDCKLNTKPVAVITPDVDKGVKPLIVNFDVKGSYDNDTIYNDTIVSYTVNYGDGTPSETKTTPGPFQHTFADTGRYRITLRVVDSRGLESEVGNARVEAVDPVTNRAPTAVLAASPKSGRAPVTVSFDASGSTDPDSGDAITMYVLDFGDGSPVVTQSSPSFSHSYTTAGNFTALLQVKDKSGLISSNTASQAISIVTGQAPIAKLDGTPKSGTAPLAVAFTAAGSSDPDSDALVEYSFDFGDGSPVVTQTSPTISHTYNGSGVYTAKVTVKDSSGAVSASPGATQITVGTPDPNNAAPTARLVSDKTDGFITATIAFDAASSTDPDSDAISIFSFDFGDGSSSGDQSSAKASHTYSKPGTYSATVKVTDARGKTSTLSTPVTITVRANRAPVAQVTSDQTSVSVGTIVLFSGGGSTDPDAADGDRITNYHYDFGDGMVLDTASKSIQHQYRIPDVFTVRMTVTDANGATNTTTQQVKVSLNATINNTAITQSKSETKNQQTGRFGGGALGLFTLLPLVGFALRRRRKVG